jgi:catechol 2,3-dioxygenase-like lactoylglutathione lyase family enzyme
MLQWQRTSSTAKTEKSPNWAATKRAFFHRDHFPGTVELDRFTARTAVSFYRDTLGLEVARETDGWTTFHTGACTLGLHASAHRELGRAEPDPRSSSATPPPSVPAWPLRVST